MQPSDQLAGFVHDGLRAGHSPEALGEGLRAAGWSDREVGDALAAWLPGQGALAAMPVPRPRPYLSARDAVVYGILFIALCNVVFGLLGLGWDVIEQVIPDITDFYSTTASNLRWPIASLVVFTPVFLWLNRRVARKTSEDTGTVRSLVRKWFASVTIIIAVIALLCDAAAVVYAFLGGELSLRFIAKAAWLAIIAGIVIAYLREEIDQGRARGWPSYTLSALAVASIVAGLALSGGPLAGRSERRDETRMSDLRQMMSQAQCLTRDGNRPAPALTITEACPGPVRMVDPFTDAPYRYEVFGTLDYRACASFEKPLEESRWTGEEIDIARGCLVGRVYDPDAEPTAEPVPAPAIEVPPPAN